MWAGGQIDFRPNRNPAFKMMGQRAFCLERISDVAIKGATGDEKIYVTIERRVSQLRPRPKQDLLSSGENRVRQSLMEAEYCSIIEHRNIVFMRKQSREAGADAQATSGKILKPQQDPTFLHVLTPTAALLFRFSALTFNAHRIHLDKQYCQETEGHRNLLVHGPLSLVLMVEVLRRHLARQGAQVINGRTIVQSNAIVGIEYRNLAPLYAEEPMKVCGKDKGQGEWDVWIEGRDGGCAVKGKVKTLDISTGPKMEHLGVRPQRVASTARDSAPVPNTAQPASDEPDAAPRHTLGDPEEYGKMPLAS